MSKKKNVPKKEQKRRDDAKKKKNKEEYEEALRRAQHLYIHCKDPKTGEAVIIETSRKLQQVIKDLMDTGMKHGADFLEQEIKIEGYLQELDKETKTVHMVPHTVSEGKVQDVMLELGNLLLSKEQTIQHLRRFITKIMDQSELTMITFDAVFETDKDGVAMTGETVIDTNPNVVKDAHYVVLDNSMKAHRERLREFGEKNGIKYPESQDEVNNIVKPGDALFSVPLSKGT
jgi:hypothetical protein